MKTSSTLCGGFAMFGGLMAGTFAALPLYLIYANRGPAHSLMCFSVELIMTLLVRSTLLGRAKQVGLVF